MKAQGLATVIGAATSVAALNDVSLTLVGMPLAGWAASFFGALFGVLYLPPPAGEQKRIPLWLAVPTLWGAGVFLAPLVGHLFGVTQPVALSGIGFLIAASPVVLVRAIIRRIGGGDAG